MKAAKAAAESANRAKSEFLANVSHELRTPLNAIIGFSEVIQNQVLGPLGNPQYQDYCTNIHTTGEDLLTRINDILDLARIETGKLELRETEVVVAEPLERAIRQQEFLNDPTCLRFCLEVDSKLPRLLADENILQKMIRTLLSNAAKFSREGGEVMVSATLDGAGAIVLSVKDSGIGMRPSDVETAITAFRQIDNSPQRKFEGLGLGLPLCMAMAQQHGATLKIKSAPGAGADVTIRFPVQRTVQAR